MTGLVYFPNESLSPKMIADIFFFSFNLFFYSKTYNVLRVGVSVTHMYLKFVKNISSKYNKMKKVLTN